MRTPRLADNSRLSSKSDDGTLKTPDYHQYIPAVALVSRGFFQGISLMWLFRLLPVSTLRWIASLQYRLPLVGPLLGWINMKLMAKEGTIRHGVGAGLRFDARGGTAGYLLGTSEPHEQAALQRWLSPGDVFYDIGANVGFFTTLAARVTGAEGMVYAFEPNPACVRQIRRNAVLNAFEHIEAFETAVSSAPGRTKLKLNDISGTSTIIRLDGKGEIDVAMTTVDEFIRSRQARPPDLVMIDVEGAEIEVLKGMQETLERHLPIVMVEVHWIGDRFLAHWRECLLPLGYRVEPLEGGDFPPSTTRYHAILLPPGK